MVTRCYKNLAMMLPHLYSGQNTVVYKLINEPYGPYPICKGFTLKGYLLGLPHWATWNHPLDCYIRTSVWYWAWVSCKFWVSSRFGKHGWFLHKGFPINFLLTWIAPGVPEIYIYSLFRFPGPGGCSILIHKTTDSTQPWPTNPILIWNTSWKP